LPADDDTEIVVVSDTVRQRRSRTPISASISNDVVVMPDLLPKASVSSDASDETQSRGEFSMVEVKERETSAKMSIFESPKVDTINIYESCSRFVPEQVETVHIIDASSDTDTPASTPQLERKKKSGSMDELKTELKRELEEISNFENAVDDFAVKKQRISFDEHKNLNGKDRDVLRDSEVEEKAIKKIKLRPSLKELWMEERNSFYDESKVNDEPLEFSDDEEIPRYSIEMDSDSDVVAKIFLIRFLAGIYLK
jgi:hypothetical protein